MNPKPIARTFEPAATPVERVYFAWNEALSRNDIAALLALYAPDAHFESPLVPHLLGSETGVLRGHKELCPLFAQLKERKPPCGNITGRAI